MILFTFDLNSLVDDLSNCPRCYLYNSIVKNTLCMHQLLDLISIYFVSTIVND